MKRKKSACDAHWSNDIFKKQERDECRIKLFHNYEKWIQHEKLETSYREKTGNQKLLHFFPFLYFEVTKRLVMWATFLWNPSHFEYHSPLKTILIRKASFCNNFELACFKLIQFLRLSKKKIKKEEEEVESALIKLSKP